MLWRWDAEVHDDPEGCLSKISVHEAIIAERAWCRPPANPHRCSSLPLLL
jgi:hypothetical protein